MRKSHDKNFKAKVALEALRGREHDPGFSKEVRDSSESDFAMEATITRRSTGAFWRANRKSEETKEAEKREELLLKAVGEMKIENDFLKKSTGKCTGKSRFSGTGV